MTTRVTSRSVWRVVIIDDSPEDRADVRRMLLNGSDWRFEFIEAATGAEGVRATIASSCGRPDSVMLDYHLPDMDALEVLAALVGSDGLTVCPVVVLTGKEHPQHGPLVLRAGAQDFIGKGWMRAESLTRAMENAAERWAMASELVARKAALQASEEQLQLAVEVAGFGVSLIDYTTQIVVLDSIAAELFDLKPGVPLPRSLLHNTFHPDDRAEVLQAIKRSLDPSEDGTFVMEHRVVHRDGSVLWLSVKKRVVFEIEGGVRRAVRSVLVAADLTTRKRAEERLRASEKELRTIANNTPDILARFDRALRHVFVNAAGARATGRPIAEMLGKSNRELGMPAELCDLWETATKSVIDTRQHASLEFNFESPSGPRIFTARLMPEFDENGRVDSVLFVSTDATERKQLEQALRDSDRQKDEFLATLAHELRNPLAPIRTGLQVIRMSNVEVPNVSRALDVMERQLGHLVRLVDDLMDVARIKSGKVELKIEKLELQMVVDHAVEATRPFVEASGNGLTVNVPKNPIGIHGDLTRLAQALGNLLNNAAKYTSSGGSITLSAGIESGLATIAVTDTGAGLSSEMLTKVFDLFAQVDLTRGQAQGGLGIGLSLVKNLLEMHGGSIAAQSPGLGLGSTFTMQLPLAAPRDEPKQKTALSNASEPARTAARRVLVVEDNEDVNELMVTMLTLFGHETRAAFNGPAALLAALAFKPDIAFLDIGLPGMSGYELAMRFRAEPTLADTVLVALTGWGGENDRRKSKQAGFDHHLTKPVHLKQLEALITELTAAAR